MIFKKNILLALSFLFIINVISSQELWYSSINSIQQSYINPAYIPDKNIIIGLASPHIDFGTGGVKLGNFTEDIDGIKTLSLQALASSLNGDVKPYAQLNLHTIDLSISIGKGALFAGHSIQFYGNTNISKGFIDLAAFGNALFIGQTITANIEGSINAYQNFYLGYSHKFGKLSLGARVNWLNGMYHFKSTNSKLEFTTSEDYYRLKLKSDYDFQSAGLLYYDDVNDEFVIDDDLIGNNLFITKNNGFALDLGAEYQLSKNAKVFASVLQLGSINWKERSNRFVNQSEYEFIGFDIKDLVDGNTDFTIEDSLEQFLDLEKTSEAFSSALPVKINAGANFHLGKMNYNLGMQVVGIDQNHTSNISLSATRELFKFLRLGLSYQIRPGSTANLGALVDLKFGPFRAFIATQNIVSAFQPSEAKSFAFISGLSVEIGSVNKNSNTNISE